MAGSFPHSVNVWISRNRATSEWIAHGFAGLLLLIMVPAFYLLHFSVHQDLAGSVLSGKLANILGEAYGTYSAYFPPAERVWFSLAARIHSFTGLRLDLIVVFMTSLAVLFSVELAYAIRRKTTGTSPLFLVISVVVLVAFPIVFKNVFGLREHMVVLGLWPYIVARISDPDGRELGFPVRLLVGIWVGWALLFKYLYAVAVLFVEIADAIVRRRFAYLFRIENLTAGLIVYLYLFVWLGLHPENREAISAMSSAIAANVLEPQQAIFRIGSELAIALAVVMAARLSGAPARQIALGMAVVVAAILVAAFQGRWYSHHEFPIYFAYVLWLWILGGNLSRWPRILLIGLIVFHAANEFRNTGFYQSTTNALKRDMDTRGISLQGKRVALLSFHPSPFNQVIAMQGGTRWTPLMNIAYVSAELKQADTAAEPGDLAPPITIVQPGRWLLHDQLMRLWEDMPPDVLILDTSLNWPLRNFRIDWKHLFSNDQRFLAILENYSFLHSHEEKGLKYEYYLLRE